MLTLNACAATRLNFPRHRLGVTNHQIADSLFVTNLIFAGSVVFTMARTHVGAETTLLATRFVILGDLPRRD